MPFTPVKFWASALLLATGLAGAQQASRNTFIVELDDMPVAGYAGKVQGYAATQPATGQKLNMRASQVQAYIGYLNHQQGKVLSAVGNVPVTHRYRVAFPGFAARLTEAEAQKLKVTAGVRAVTRDSLLRPLTSRTPSFLGLGASGGLWSSHLKGENVIIGIIDSGISPENPSFSDRVDASGKPVPAHSGGTLVYAPVTASRTWAGACESGPGFAATDCNNKLIGARAYRAGFDDSGLTLPPTEFASPRDGDGHGSHTASTAGGNEGVPAMLGTVAVGHLAGIAPRARIAAYKVCYQYVGDTTGQGTCTISDSVAAIDQAVADGVDILNFSISGTQTNYRNAVEIAFLNATAAGVFVAASAGNNGPGNQVAHMSPWLTTVAASTHDRLTAADLVLADGSRHSGASLQAAGLGSAAARLPLVRSVDAGMAPYANLSADDQAALRLCFRASDGGGAGARLNPALVAGAIVVCERGTSARVDKSLAVAEAGGAGMVLLNTTAAQSLDEDIHAVPSVHLASSARSTVNAYAATPGATAYLTSSAALLGGVAPVMAGFSSRGPSLADPNILKPDITAPGVAVYAATTHVPADAAAQAAVVGGAHPAPTFGSYSGTSMSSPHVAGIAALLRQAHPGWSPAAIKSALMTTTTEVKLASGANDTNRFGYGAGHVNPNAATAVDLVYDAGLPDYLAFLCGQGLLNPSGGTCNAVGLLPAWNLNLPSLTADVTGVQRLWRTVTNVGSGPVTYSASVSMPGFEVTVNPATLSLAAGQSQTFSVTALRTSAAMGSWAFGNLVWRDGARQVTSPLTLRPLHLATPALMEEDRVRASRLFTVATGYNGTMKHNTIGLVPATRIAGTVKLGKQACTDVVVPDSAQWLRAALFNRDTTGQGGDDLDLYLYNSAGKELALSGGPDADELITLASPAAGTYTLCVDGYAPVGGASAYTLSMWVGAAANALPNALRVVTPAKVVTAGTGTVAFQWSVPANQRYYTTVQFTDGGSTQTGRTALFIDGMGPVPASLVRQGLSAAKMAAKAAR